jgi:hypothetical protein
MFWVFHGASCYNRVIVVFGVQYEERTTAIDTEMSEKSSARSSIVVGVLLSGVFPMGDHEIFASIYGVRSKRAAGDLLTIPTLAQSRSRVSRGHVFTDLQRQEPSMVS